MTDTKQIDYKAVCLELLKSTTGEMECVELAWSDRDAEVLLLRRWCSRVKVVHEKLSEVWKERENA